MQGAEAWLEVRQERRLDFLAWGHVGNIAARRHGRCGIPRQWGAGVTRDGAGRLWRLNINSQSRMARWEGGLFTEHPWKVSEHAWAGAALEY